MGLHASLIAAAVCRALGVRDPCGSVRTDQIRNPPRSSAARTIARRERPGRRRDVRRNTTWHACRGRSEEHTSELQSRRDLVCRLLLEKKKKKKKNKKKGKNI